MIQRNEEMRGEGKYALKGKFTIFGIFLHRIKVHKGGASLGQGPALDPQLTLHGPTIDPTWPFLARFH